MRITGRPGPRQKAGKLLCGRSRPGHSGPGGRRDLSPGRAGRAAALTEVAFSSVFSKALNINTASGTSPGLFPNLSLSLPGPLKTPKLLLDLSLE